MLASTAVYVSYPCMSIVFAMSSRGTHFFFLLTLLGCYKNWTCGKKVTDQITCLIRGKFLKFG